MDLEQALEQFDTTEANLLRLEAVWAEMQRLIPNGIAFMEGSTEGRRYQELARAFDAIAGALPKVASFSIDSRPLGLNEIAQGRFDVAEIGEVSAEIGFEEAIDRPTAASGRFGTDTVDWIEKHNNAGDRPRIELWANSHLELLLARRPHLAVALGLRP